MDSSDSSALDRSLELLEKEAKLFATFCDGWLPLGCCPSCGIPMTDTQRSCSACGFEMKPQATAILSTEWGFVVLRNAKPKRVLRRFELSPPSATR